MKERLILGTLGLTAVSSVALATTQYLETTRLEKPEIATEIQIPLLTK